jgi:hypothetical protein
MPWLDEPLRGKIARAIPRLAAGTGAQTRGYQTLLDTEPDRTDTK